MNITLEGCKSLAEFIGEMLKSPDRIQRHHSILGLWEDWPVERHFDLEELACGRYRIKPAVKWRPFKQSEVFVPMYVRDRGCTGFWRAIQGCGERGLWYQGEDRRIQLSYDEAFRDLECSRDLVVWTPCGALKN